MTVSVVAVSVWDWMTRLMWARISKNKSVVAATLTHDDFSDH